MSSAGFDGSQESPDERGPDAGGHPPDRAGSTGQPASPPSGRSFDRKEQNDAWGASGMVMSGVAVWGGVGYLLSRWFHHDIFVVVGILVGTAVALYGVWFRYGRS
jgi:ATP synthase protein I